MLETIKKEGNKDIEKPKKNRQRAEKQKLVSLDGYVIEK